ncbi:hypothetical protein B0F90DRAFT_965179 [Multifurca ochricompacta]|uniref:Uncharacterized protein n=1 Tax=Multifurca ochricompacta TaxID=376703 RepID=A0AAD4QNR2_9AGAM|nr:hypothetical protein B0F90DRAFT_965179 [Multifurca ochricompacta]
MISNSNENNLCPFIPRLQHSSFLQLARFPQVYICGNNAMVSAALEPLYYERNLSCLNEPHWITRAISRDRNPHNTEPLYKIFNVFTLMSLNIYHNIREPNLNRTALTGRSPLPFNLHTISQTHPDARCINVRLANYTNIISNTSYAHFYNAARSSPIFNHRSLLSTLRYTP